MITIITGKFNSNKTSKMIEIYETNHLGDGFVQVKIMEENQIYGYKAMHLISGEKRLIMIHQNFFQDEFVCREKIGPYCVHPSTKVWIEKEVNRMIDHRIQPIYLDEIGILELDGFGYDSILKKMVASTLDLVLSIREDLVKKVVEHYGLTNVIIKESSL